MVSKFAKQLAGNRKGQGLVEYGILAAGVALICLVSVSVLGHKTSSLIGTLAAILPGTESTDSGAIASGSLIETQVGTNQVTQNSEIILNAAPASDGADSDRLDGNVGINSTDIGTGPGSGSVLVLDPDSVQ